MGRVNLMDPPDSPKGGGDKAMSDDGGGGRGANGDDWCCDVGGRARDDL